MAVPTRGRCSRLASASGFRISKVATRKLAQLDAAHTPDFLRSPPGNRPEGLHGREDHPRYFFDHLGRAHVRLAFVATGLGERAALAQKVPVLVELDLDLDGGESPAFGSIERSLVEQAMLRRRAPEYGSVRARLSHLLP
jgi:hypothetical protein